MKPVQGSTGVKHLCCGEHSPVFPSNYCPFCGKSVHLYGVEVDVKGLGSFFADKLEVTGVKVVKIGQPSPSLTNKKKELSPVEKEAISVAFRRIGLALHATNGVIATDIPDRQPDETSWRVDHSMEILALQHLEYRFNNTAEEREGSGMPSFARISNL